MLPWVKLGETTMPGGGTMTLMQRGSEFSIMSGVVTLMNSRQNHSEEQLATLSADRVGARPKARILIGGLGMGFTLRAALQCFAADSEIVVAELVPEVVAWARGRCRSPDGLLRGKPVVRAPAAQVTNIPPELPGNAVDRRRADNPIDSHAPRFHGQLAIDHQPLVAQHIAFDPDHPAEGATRPEPVAGNERRDHTLNRFLPHMCLRCRATRQLDDEVTVGAAHYVEIAVLCGKAW